MRILRILAFVLAALSIGQPAFAQGISNLPRQDTIIIENPQGTITNPTWFNIWVVARGGVSTGLQQLGMDTLWYIDADAGLDGVRDNSLAADKPQYNADFTEMTVKLREGIYWSDGVEFTADDVVYTVETQIKNPSMLWGPVFAASVEAVTAPDKHTVLFKLKRPNSRFHATFTVRWNAAWIMPKHVFEKVEDPTKYDFNPPVTLGPYKLHSFDPNGKWYIWEKREDWQRTTLARFGEPGPKYAAYIDPGPPDKRVILQLNHQLDIIHDTSPEGVFTLVKQSPSSHGWFKGFPYAHPDPTLPSVMFNHQVKPFDNPDVRWALALLINIKAVSMASYRGAATISAIGVPPTGLYGQYYFEPMEDWLKNFEIDTGKSKYKPYDPTAGQQIADMLRPSMGDQIPTDAKEIAKAFGRGWWKPNPEVATELLERAGFTKQDNQWMKPDGTPFKITLLVEGDQRPVMTRAGTMIVQQWRQFGIQAETQAYPSDFFPRVELGDYEAAIAWSVETWGGHPDLSFFLDSWHSEFLKQPGDRQPPRNRQRWKSAELDKIIEQIRKIDFDDPRGTELGIEYIKLAVKEMPTIPLMSYNVFTMMDTTYWTGYPNAETNPYTNPVPNWANTKYMFVKLKPAQSQ
ncbi:MAG TPA: ABC transporter substrate-binding protein [Mesorhizobium sp.]|nr:ABC transporter substrate-binding protein [Mesorhizobium sp.]